MTAITAGDSKAIIIPVSLIALIASAILFALQSLPFTSDWWRKKIDKNPSPLAVVGRGALVVAEVITLWFATTITIGTFLNFVFLPDIIASPTTPSLTEHDFVFYTGMIAAVFVFGVFSSTANTILGVPAGVPEREIVDGWEVVLWRMFWGDYDFAAPSSTMFSPRLYAFVAGVTYVFQVTTDTGDFKHRSYIALFAGGFGGVFAIEAYAVATLAFLRVTRTEQTAKGFTNHYVAKIFKRIALAILCILVWFLGWNLYTMHIEDAWTNTVSGDMGYDVKRIFTYMVPFLPIAVLFMAALIRKYMCSRSNGMSRVPTSLADV